MRFGLLLLLLVSLGSSKAQTYEIGCNFFRNGYGNHSSGNEGIKSKYMNGYEIIIKRVQSKNAKPRAFRHIELGAQYFKGNAYYSYGNHFGADREKVNTEKILAYAALYPLNFQFFKEKTHFSAGAILGGFLYQYSSGKTSITNIRDTVIPPYGHIQIPYQIEHEYSGKTRYNQRFILGLGVQLNQNIHTWESGTLKGGLFARLYITPEFVNLVYLFPRQFGLQLTWMFKPHTQ